MPNTLAQIREGLGHFTLKWEPRVRLDTGVPDLNRVAGHKVRGLPYGRIIEMSGLESHGKTAIALAVSALGQRDGAAVDWVDLENSWDNGWAAQRGVEKCPDCAGTGRAKDGRCCKKCGPPKPLPCTSCDGAGCGDCAKSGQERGSGLNPDKLTLIQPYVGRFMVPAKKLLERPKLGPPRLSTGTELLAEAEECVKINREKFDRQILVIDSLTAILTKGEATAGIEHANLRTQQDLPAFLSRLLRRWVGMAQAYNVLVILVNQLREDPMAKFGSPWYTPGGNATHFYSHIRVRVARVKGGKVMDKGKMAGIQGVMKAVKNKSGGDEGAEVGYKIMFKGPVQFLPAKDIKKAEKGDAE